MMKRNYFFVLLLVAFVPFVSAQYFGGGFWYGTEQVIDSIVMNLEPIFRALLGGYDWSGYLLFEKVLLFILISIVVGLILQKIPVFENWKNKRILRLVAIIIGILAVRNLNYIWVGTILVQYQVLFIAVAGFLPFLIYWYFAENLVEDNSSYGGWIRKLAWIFYSVIYFGLWATTDLAAYSEVYLWSALAALIYAFFFDTMVHRWLAIQKAKKGDFIAKQQLIASIKNEIAETIRLQSQGHMTKDVADAIVKRKQETIKSIIK